MEAIGCEDKWCDMFADSTSTKSHGGWSTSQDMKYYSLPICLTQSYTVVFGVSTSEFQTHVPLAQEISISDYLDLIELAEDHETGISWYMGKLPLHTDVPEMFEDICNAPNSPWRDLGEVVFRF